MEPGYYAGVQTGAAAVKTLIVDFYGAQLQLQLCGVLVNLAMLVCCRFAVY